MAQQPDAPTDNISFGQFTGIKNTVSRERLAPTELEIAKNVDIDDAGQLRRRRGFTRVATGSFHSAFTTDDGATYCVKDDALVRVMPDYTFQQVTTGIGNAPVAYVHVGDIIYYSSQLTSGKFHHPTLAHSPWGAVAGDNTWLSPVVNPVPGLAPVKGKLLGPPPLATSLAYYNGRIYMAQGNVVWATELYLYDYVDKTKNYMMYETDVTALAAVTDGLYIGTKTSIWFQSGPFNEMRRTAAANCGVYPGSAASVAPAYLPDQIGTNTNSAVLMFTDMGLLVALDGGKTLHMTQGRVRFPEAIRLNSLFRSQDGVNQYIGVADSAGSPSASTRIGDYVDAEIRRFQGA